MENKLSQKENDLNARNVSIESLKKEIKKKDEEINILKEKNQNVNKKISFDQVTCVYFTSADLKVNIPIPCIKSDVFAEVEEKLYQEYPEYRETNNYFIVNGIQVLRFKTVEQNNIKNNKPVLLIVPEKDKE